MRATRLLALLGTLATPALAPAQTPGSVVGAFGDDLTINAEECGGIGSPAPEIQLAWWVSVPNGIVSSGVYRVYAANQAPTETDGLSLCKTEDEPTSSTTAGQVPTTTTGEILASPTDRVVTATFPTRAFAEQSGRSCAEGGDQNIYVCVHFYRYQQGTTTPSGTATGSATGILILSTGKPARPLGLTITPGDRRLYAKWTAGTGGAVGTTDYLLAATPSGGGETVTNTATGTTGQLDGLVNDRLYSVVVYARSASGTLSLASDAQPGTPVAVSDFWDVYNEEGGTDSGGCGGPAGPLALLGLAGAALALRRRNP